MRHISPIDQQSRLLDTVYEKLCDAIFHNEIEAGARLSVPHLASRFGVSRSPIKEAVQQLVTDGIAEAIPRRGVFVAEFDEEDILNLLDITLPLEGLAGRQVATRISDNEIRNIEEIIERQEAAYKSEDRTEYAKWDSLFHNAIARATQNERLEYFLRILHNQIRLVSRRMLFSTAMLKSSLADHKAILKAIKQHDPDKCEALFIKHVSLSKERLQDKGSISQPVHKTARKAARS